MTVRRCMDCGSPITQCFGFTLARDVVALFEGRRTENPRERCARCVELIALGRRPHLAPDAD